MFYPTAFPSKFVRHYHYSKLNQLSIELCVVQNVFCFIPTRILVQHVFTKKPPEAKHANHRFTTKTVNLYVSIQPKSFHSWIKSFLQREGVEELLQKSVDYSNSTPCTLCSVWDGNIWNLFKDSDGNVFTKQIGNLCFGIYSDWFNPLGNKIAGKHKSVGVILLFCLSLPATHCYQLQKILFAGITPGPSKPTVLKINNVIAPLVSELRLFWQPGVVIPTFKHPKAEITSLYYGSWPPQSFQGHQTESQEWKNATTHAERKALLESTGMLEWHCRKLWGLDVIAADISDSKKLVQVGYPVTEDYFDEDEWEEN
ncbi:hypothetical protein PSHT_08560 [Puccinia striiformis]|uniref:Uncharacterized protein n=1 Tax=Puccinia striiformis TaxID=27350 RepID=A0A2S4VNB6_9BASI|nr:hypothetical protein PSHT_08560 [Puccinia striiformis]